MGSKASTEIGKSSKSMIIIGKRSLLPNFRKPNDDIQIEFGGPVINERGIEQYFLASIDRYSKYPTVEIVNNPSSTKIIKFLNTNKYNHGVPRTIRFDQARCSTGKKFEAICIEKKFESLYANSNNHRAIGLVELLIQTIKRRQSCMKAHLKKNDLEHAIHQSIIQIIQISN